MRPYEQLDEATFEERYRPLRDPDGAWRDFSWLEPEDQSLIEVAAREHRIWTTVDVNGFVLVTAGSHFVNRLGYVITEVAFDPNAQIDVLDPEDWTEWTERGIGYDGV